MIKVNDTFYSRTMDPEIAAKGECGGSITTLMKFLLEEEIVDAVLAVGKGADLYDAVPILINNPNEIIESAGSLHCGTLNIAKIIEKYLDGAYHIKIAVTTKPCDAMAVNELVKRDRIDRENIIMFGINCGGTFHPLQTRRMIENKGINPNEVVNEEISKGKFIIKTSDNKKEEFNIDMLELEDKGRRKNCRRCEFNIPIGTDVAFGNWGVINRYRDNNSFVEILTEKGAEIFEKAFNNGVIKLEQLPVGAVELREKIDINMVNMARISQKEMFSHVEGEFLSVLFKYEDELAKCIKCFGCKESCPICYCSDCSLKSEIPEWINNTDVPPKPLFHMERLLHMVDSCINCGQCEDVCPVDIPLSKISHEINSRLREIFNYTPGIDNEKPPLSF